MHIIDQGSVHQHQSNVSLYTNDLVTIWVGLTEGLGTFAVSPLVKATSDEE